MMSRLQKIKLEFEYFEAVDGKTLSEDEINRSFKRSFLENLPDQYTVGQMGSSLSHRGIYQKMVADNIEWALILEDDMVLDETIEEFLQDLTKVMDSSDLVLLYFQSFSQIVLNRANGIKVNERFSLYEAPDQGYNGAGAYFISLAAAKKLVNATERIESYVDDWQFYKSKNCFRKIYLVHPFIAWSSLDPSDISVSHNRLIRFINRFHVPILYSILKLRRSWMFKRMRMVKLR